MAGAVTIEPSAFPLSGKRARLEYARGGREGVASRVELRVVRVADSALAGLVTLEVEADALVVRALCIESAFRSYGLGSECGALLRGYAEQGPWTVLRASAAPNLGLSAYFWTRMGLHPLHGEGPDGGIWFERSVSGIAEK